jgi:TolB protein
MSSQRSVPALLLFASLLMGACMPQGMRLPQNELLAALERKSGLIAYLGYDGNIYVVDQGGGNSKQITDDARVDSSSYLVYSLPVWAADGQQLAFAAYEGLSNENPSNNSLFIAQKDGSGLSQAYASSDYVVFYYWSPDGQKVGVLSETPGQTLALKLVPAVGGDSETLDTGSPFYWTWSPDGQSVLIHAGGEDGRLAVLQLGESVVERGLNITPTAFKAPAFSPDGRQILYAGKTSEGRSSLYVADRDGANARALTEYENEIAFVWSPDGRRVAYIDSPQLDGPITVIDPSGGQSSVTIEEDAYAFFWSPDSKSMAYFATETFTPEGATEPQTIWKLMVMDAASGQTRRLATFLPTERFLQLIPYFDQYHQSLTIWSPDSQNLVVSAYSGDGTPGIFVVAASGNLEPRFISEGLMGVWSWR